MTTKNPEFRIEGVTVTGAASLRVEAEDGRIAVVDLTGWIATGGEMLAPLRDPAIFATARIGDYGLSIEWGDPESDLAIDEEHLNRIAREQEEFTRGRLVEWQLALDLSNQEAADLLDVALSTYTTYKAQGSIPTAVAIACRAAERDPLILHAHYKPRKTGRPRKST